ncbi:MAG: type II toxin-antitoxin system VapC family toxin [Tildeniella nuda ZEHNDER 1965/U140]|jgi:tRNA(fMet)-specific endonuclease VapC|nr:type II toxin-antitoxin system VapC family toxin [Tildeniella nuda ZEHNDER 1965/U140]
MHLLDTDTLTYLHAGQPNVIKRLNDLEDPDVGITIITKIEVLRGRMDYVLKAETGTRLLRAQELLARTEALLVQILTLPLDLKAAEQFESLQLVGNLRKIGRADLLIASIALANQAVLVTRNTRHFKQIPNLRVVNWVD